MKNANYLILILVFLFSTESFAVCNQFETALEKAMARVAAREEKKAIAANPTLEAEALKKAWTSPEAQAYRQDYAKLDHSSANNRKFIEQMKANKERGATDRIYFNTENQYQKALNDVLIQDKGMVDAFNNSFLTKLNKNMQDFPTAKKYIEAKSMGYKAEDIELFANPSVRSKLEEELSALYAKTNKQFVNEMKERGLTKLIPPRTDGMGDVSTWFLSGTGDTALQANMATRYARKLGFSGGGARTVHFKEVRQLILDDILKIEDLRKKLVGTKGLFEMGLLEKTKPYNMIPSRGMINILRTIKPEECADAAEYAFKIRQQVQKIFGAHISDDSIKTFSAYFQKQNSLSPPIFESERVIIKLSEAKEDIISVDFAGIGVDNAQAQMQALSIVNFKEKDSVALLDDAFERIQEGVDIVTHNLLEAKRYFAIGTIDPTDTGVVPLFTGDDGIKMPNIVWTEERKKELIRYLSKYEGDPSKFRVTTSKVKVGDYVVPGYQRSKNVVRAETIEKGIRKKVVGIKEVPIQRADKMIISVDFVPSANGGGSYSLILGGLKPTPQERQLIIDAFKNNLKEGEVVGKIVEIYN